MTRESAVDTSGVTSMTGRPAHRGTSVGSPAPGRNALARTVLIVDDSPEVRVAIAAALENEGWRVETAADGAAALHLLMKSQPPDVILADVEMPDLDGISLFQCLRLVPSLARIPFVQMTAWTPPAYAPGAVAMLQKPIRLETLIAVVDSIALPQEDITTLA